MKDYSVLNGMIENQKSELRTAYDKGYNHGVRDFDLILVTSKKEEESYNRGVNDLWESVCKFMDADIVSDKEIWGCTSWEKFAQLSPSEVIERLKEYNKKQEHIIRCCKNCKHSENGMVGNSKRCEVCYYDEVLKANRLFEPMETDNSEIEVEDEINKKHYDLPETMRGKINIGDELRNSTNNHIGIVVKNVDENSVKIISSWGNTAIWELKNCNKTGKCFKDFAERLLSLQDDE